MIALATLQMVLGVLTGWLDCREREAIAYLSVGTTKKSAGAILLEVVRKERAPGL